MEVPPFFTPFNRRIAIKRSKALPYQTSINQFPVTCTNCKFINRVDYNFCTNCGFPVRLDSDKIAVYNLRMHKRKLLLERCMTRISQARNALYILSGIFMLGMFYLFSNWKETVMRGFVMITLAVIYFYLGWSSHEKPFTSLLISFIIMLTFAAIHVWAELSAGPFSGSGVCIIFVEVIVIYFQLQGVKAAFHADILKEELKV